jgi:hypothetical protein
MVTTNPAVRHIQVDTHTHIYIYISVMKWFRLILKLSNFNINTNNYASKPHKLTHFPRKSTIF